MVTLDDSTKSDVFCLKEDFTQLSLSARHQLKKRYPDAGDAKVFVNEMLRGRPDEPLVVRGQISNHDEIFDLLQEKWSPTNPTLLQQLINCIGDDSHKERMLKYSNALDHFKSSLHLSPETLNGGISFEDHLDPYKPCLILVIEMSKTSLSEIYDFLDEVFGFYQRYLRVHKIQRGCIKVTMQFPVSMTQLLQKCITQKSGFVKSFGSLKIEPPYAQKDSPDVSSQGKQSHTDLPLPQPTETVNPKEALSTPAEQAPHPIWFGDVLVS